jgi:C-terminal processing protease CtpA/Prc
MKSCLCLAALAARLCCAVLPCAAAEQPLKLEEVLSVVRTNLSISEPELSGAAALGLIQQLGSKVQLVSTNTEAKAAESGAAMRTGTFDNFGYFRVERVGSGAAGEVQKGWEALAASNHLKGAILDLRYAKGADYKAAAELADLFVQTERVLMKAGEVEHRSASGGSEIRQPLAVLVNRQTAGAPEALAAALRQAGAALLIGSSTAGEARLFESFDLSTGQTLRIGTVPVLVAGEPIPSSGVVPDVPVQVSGLDERAYFQDPYAEVARLPEGQGTNDMALGQRGRRFNEAELVRRHREGSDLLAPMAEEPGATKARVVTDPVLARAIDFLKGVSALRLSSPN